MNIISAEFFLFALATVILYHARQRTLWRQALLLFANLLFLASYHQAGPLAFVPMLGFIGLGYLGVLLLQRRPGGRFLWPCLAACLLLFVWLKKYTFIPAELLIPAGYVSIGLSYVFFRVMQMLIDAGESQLAGRVRLIDYLNFVLNFTTLISGPIQRYEDYLHDRQSPEPVHLFSAAAALERIVLGVFKVLVLASLVFTLQKAGIDALQAAQHPADKALAGLALTAGYSIYLYFNFSGYTDIVIGLGRFLGMRLPENFNRPFSAGNFMEFWARWHMTLSNWLKFYVYNPLLKNLLQRHPQLWLAPYLGVFAFFFTFFLIGLWHGQTAVFALYGFLLGLGVSGNKLYQLRMQAWLGRKAYKALTGNRLYQTFARGLTFTWFSLSLVCFWADWSQISSFCNLLGKQGIGMMCALLWLSASLLLATGELWRRFYLGLHCGGVQLAGSRYLRTAWVTAMLAITVGSALLMNGPAPDIVYKNF